MKPDELALDALAAHRLTRLATADTITRPARARIIRGAYARRQSNPAWIKRHDGEDDAYWRAAKTDAEWDDTPIDDDNAPKLAAFIKCRWCVGVWISGFVVAARRYAPVLWDPIGRALALSTVAALLAELE